MLRMEPAEDQFSLVKIIDFLKDNSMTSFWCSDLTLILTNEGLSKGDAQFGFRRNLKDIKINLNAVKDYNKYFKSITNSCS